MSPNVHNLLDTPLRPLPPNRSTVVGVIDVGSDKICCLIAKLKPRQRDGARSIGTHDIQVLGVGFHRSSGIKSGVVMDMEAAERAIRRSIDSAERMAGVTLESVMVNISCGRIASETFSAEIEVRGAEIAETEVQRVLQAGPRLLGGRGPHRSPFPPDRLRARRPTGHWRSGWDGRPAPRHRYEHRDRR